MVATDTDELLKAGLNHHQAGRLAEAEACYRRVLAAEPQHAGALHLLGGIAIQVRRYDLAVELIGQAIKHDGRNSVYFSNLGVALEHQDKLDAAAAAYRQAIHFKPDRAEAHANLGNVLKKQNQLEEALESYDKALALKPDYAETLNNRGVALLELKRLDEALASFEKAVALKPDYAEAFNNRGNVLGQLKRLDEALATYEKAVALKPDYADAFNNRGSALSELKRLDEALASYDQALALKPDDADALVNRGNALKALKRFDEALASYDKALSLKPGYAAVFNSRGVVLKELERLGDALASFDRALALKPDYAEAFNNRGNALKELMRLDEALASYDKAVALKPDYVEAFNNRGNALRELNRLDEALASYDKALALRPDADAFSNRGVALMELRRLDEAVASYDKAIAIRPDYAEVLSNRGNALRELRRFEEALGSCDRAIALKPDQVEAYVNRGIALMELMRFDDALANCNRALIVRPDYAEALAARAGILQAQGKIDEAIATYRRALAIKPDDATLHTNLIFALNFDASASEADKQDERVRWNERHARQFTGNIGPHTNDPDPFRRLRIGYVTDRFRHQAAVYAFGGALLCQDPGQFEVFCYSDTLQDDDVTACLRNRADQWRNISGLSDDKVAALVRDDRIDILVDLVGHMTGHRLRVFARKPAPIQVTAWGEPTGTGLQTMDYLLADPVLVPAADRGLLTEQVVDLPNCLGFWTPEPLPEPGPLPAIASGHVTFGSFNRVEKILYPVIQSWAMILRALPAARLVLKDRTLVDFSQRARIEDAFTKEGISPERLTLLGGSDRTSHFSAYRKIDIALDSFPHSGGMTTLDALWMGVPVVTWPGRTISSRLAAASLSTLGLTDFIAADADGYVKLAVAKGSDLSALAGLRASLRAHIAGSVIGDAQRYARAVEFAYREMWRRWCAAGEGRSRDHRKEGRRATSRYAGNAREATDLESFSQHGQDVFVYNHFFRSLRGGGTFVDIGAYDGISFSNSLFFERHLGWNGVCIEPLPLVFDELRNNRDAICMNCAVSDLEGVENFIDVDMPDYGKMYSGLAANYDERHIRVIREGATGRRVIKVRTRKLSDILDESGVTKVDYLSIDTEGSEFQILKSFDPNAYGVRVISVENNYQDPQIRDHLFGLGYQLVKIFAGFDELYAKRD